jgi:hypothetical protein
VIRAVIDEVVPADVISALSDEEVVVDAFPEDWRSLPDGAMIANAIERGYAWLITCDKRMAFQQNLSGRAIAVLVLPTPRAPEIERIQRNVRAALRAPLPGHFVILDGVGLPIGKPAAHLAGSAKRTL